MQSVASIPWRGPQAHIIIACSTLKGTRSDWLVEKCTEMGAHTLSPLLTERSPTMPGADKHEGCVKRAGGGRSARWQRVRVAAVKQCLRVHDMAVTEPLSVSDVVRMMTSGSTQCFVAAEGGAPVLQALANAPLSTSQERADSDTVRSGADAMPDSELRGTSGGHHEVACRASDVQCSANAAALVLDNATTRHAHGIALESPLAGEHGSRDLLVIGPEGDFTKKELQCLIDAGAVLVGLGQLRLRTETAALALLSAHMLHSNRQNVKVEA